MEALYKIVYVRVSTGKFVFGTTASSMTEADKLYRAIFQKDPSQDKDIVTLVHAWADAVFYKLSWR